MEQPCVYEQCMCIHNAIGDCCNTACLLYRYIACVTTMASFINADWCQPSQFECDYFACINSTLVCNGVYDCYDRYDEHGCRTLSDQYHVYFNTLVPAKTLFYFGFFLVFFFRFFDLVSIQIKAKRFHRSLWT